MTTWIVLPAFNEERGLQVLLPTLMLMDVRVVVIDDCSDDSTLSIVSRYPSVHVLSHSRNMGYAESLFDGISYAFNNGSEYVITMDSDCQHPASYITSIIDLLKNGYPLVITSRPHLPRLSEMLCGFISRILWSISDPFCGMRGFTRSFWKTYSSYHFRLYFAHPFISSYKSGLRPVILPLPIAPRIGGNPRFATRLTADLVILISFFNSLFIRD